MSSTAQDPGTARPRRSRPFASVSRAIVEIAFIIFLFYSNLLMGEFNRIAGQGKTLAFALHDILTLRNFTIAIIAAFVGYIIVESLRRKL